MYVVYIGTWHTDRWDRPAAVMSIPVEGTVHSDVKPTGRSRLCEAPMGGSRSSVSGEGFFSGWGNDGEIADLSLVNEEVLCRLLELYWLNQGPTLILEEEEEEEEQEEEGKSQDCHSTTSCADLCRLETKSGDVMGGRKIYLNKST